MRSIDLKGMTGKFLLAFSLLFGVGIASGMTAQAQWQTDPYRNDRDYRREREREQRRREREYRREQERRNRDYDNDDYSYSRDRDYDRNRDYDYQNDQWRRNGNNGGWGRRSNDGYGNYGGSFDLRQTALNAGFADGVKAGRKDRQRGRGYDFSDESDFQKGTRDYSSRLGDRYIYQRYYREAFAHGYADGYAGY